MGFEAGTAAADSGDSFSGFDPSAFEGAGETGGAASAGTDAFGGFDPSSFQSAGETGGAAVGNLPTATASAQGAQGLSLSNAIDRAYKDSWLQSVFGGGSSSLTPSQLDATANPLAAGNAMQSAQQEITNGKIAAGLGSLNPSAAGALTPAAKGGISTTTLALGALAALGSILGKQKQPDIPGPGSTAATQGPLFNTPLSGKGANGTLNSVRTPATFPSMTNQDWYTYGNRPALSFYNNNRVGFAGGGSVGGRTPAIPLNPGGNQSGSNAGGAGGNGGYGSNGPGTESPSFGGQGVGAFGYGSSPAAADTSAGRSTDIASWAANALTGMNPGMALVGAMANAAFGTPGQMGWSGMVGNPSFGWGGSGISAEGAWGGPTSEGAMEGAFSDFPGTTASTTAAGMGGDPNAMAGGAGVGGFGSSTGAASDTAEAGPSGLGASAGDTGGGTCYITTAAVDHMGLDDNGPELNTLRHFRDKVLAKTPEGQDMIAEYKTVAPHIVEEINKRKDANKIYRSLYSNYIAPAVTAANEGDNQAALDYYGSMVKQLENDFPEKVMAARGGGVRKERSVFDTDDGEHYVRGGTAGQADTRNAKLSDGEFVFDSASVADIGDGNNEAGAQRLEEMRQRIAKHKGRKEVVPPKAKSPLEYLRKAG